MKKTVLIFGIAAMFMSCGTSSTDSSTASTSEAQEAAVAESANQSFTVNAAESSVSWKGTKPAGDAHTGTVAIKKGMLSAEGNVITAGSFVMDLTQMTVTDEGMDDETKGKLVGHLSNGDFFEVEKYPMARFEVSSATADSLTGNLTIKDVTKSITVPYFFQNDNGAAMASSTFTIDRTIWGVTYNSGNFFENLGDYLIDDMVSFQVSLKASK